MDRRHTNPATGGGDVPEDNRNHNADQVFYFGDTFMQRRMDYSPDVTGKPPVTHYLYDHNIFDGFLFRRDGSCTFTTQTASQPTIRTNHDRRDRG